MASRKLKPYFQALPIKVLTGRPIRKMIESRNHLTRMTEWADQLANFKSEYEPRRAIKAQTLADFISECSSRTIDREERGLWELQVEGSATQSGSGVGIVITPLIGDKMNYAVKFKFLTSNNEAEYETLIIGLQICINSGAQVATYSQSDSQLIVGKIFGG